MIKNLADLHKDFLFFIKNIKIFNLKKQLTLEFFLHF